MPAKANPIHMDAVPHLYRLMEHTKVLYAHAFKHPIDDAGRADLLRLALESLKASGVTGDQLYSAIHTAFPQEATPVAPSKLDPVPTISIPVTTIPVAVASPKSELKPDAVVTHLENTKPGGLFSRK